MKTNTMNATEKLLVENHLHLVPAMVNALTRSYSQITSDEIDELKQIGYLAICEAAKKYDGIRPFKPYANASIRNAIYDYWRESGNRKNVLCSLDAMLTAEDGDSYEQLFPSLSYHSPEHDVLQKEADTYLSILEKQSCHMIQKGILSLRLQQNGYTSTDLAKLFNVPPNRIRAWQSKARTVLKHNQSLYMLLAS